MIPDEECETCQGIELYECKGNADPGAFIDGDTEDVFRATGLIFNARERQWTPTEYFAQPARWVAAYEFMLPYTLRLIDEYRQKKQAEHEALARIHPSN